MNNKSGKSKSGKSKLSNSAFSKQIGRRINSLLAEKDIKQKELAQYLGVPDNTISYFCRGERCPNIEQISKIATFFNTSADYLLGLPTMNLEKEKERYFVQNYTGLDSLSVNAIQSNRYKEEQNDIIREGLLLLISADLYSYKQATKMIAALSPNKTGFSEDKLDNDQIELLDKYTTNRDLAIFRAYQGLTHYFEKYDARFIYEQNVELTKAISEISQNGDEDIEV